MREGSGQQREAVDTTGFAALFADLDRAERAAPLDDGLRRLTASLSVLKSKVH